MRQLMLLNSLWDFRCHCSRIRLPKGQPAFSYSHGPCEVPYRPNVCISLSRKYCTGLPPWFSLCLRLLSDHSKACKLAFVETPDVLNPSTVQGFIPSTLRPELHASPMPPGSHIWLTPNVYTAPATANAYTSGSPRAPFILRATPF